MLILFYFTCNVKGVGEDLSHYDPSFFESNRLLKSKFDEKPIVEIGAYGKPLVISNTLSRLLAAFSIHFT